MTLDWAAVAPELALTVGAIVVLLFDMRLQGWWRQIAALLTLVTIGVGLALTVMLIGTTPRITLGDMFVLDGFALVLKGFFLATGAVAVLLSMGYMRGHRYEGEYYFLLLIAVVGAMLMASSRDLLMLLISLELVSVPGFVLAGLRKSDPRSNEAAVKFFVFGVISAALFAYGISLVYGFTGSTNLGQINVALQALDDPQPLFLGAIVLIVASFGFKVSAVPVHFWAPDTYQGCPTPLAAFLSVTSKAAGFVGLAVIMLIGFPSIAGLWAPVLVVICGATMTLGNVAALRQTHLIRLLAYSSIAQAGYMLIPIALILPGAQDPATGLSVAPNTDGVIRALVIYLLIYGVMNFGAFAVAIGISKQYPTMLISDLTGMARRSPFHAAALTVFLISLGGIPPLAGFWAKFFIFMTAVNAGTVAAFTLAALMVVNSVISLYYYVGVARTMYLRDPLEEGAVGFPRLATAVAAAGAAGVIGVGIYPETFVRIAEAATLLLP